MKFLWGRIEKSDLMKLELYLLIFFILIFICGCKDKDASTTSSNASSETKASIYENFNDNTINDILWKIDNEDMELVKEVDSQLSMYTLSTDNGNN